MRTSHTQLPSNDEMMHIAAAEAQRPLAEGKTGVHYVNFDAIGALCAHMGVDTDLFLLDDKTSDTILTKGAALVDTLVPKLLSQPPRADTEKLLQDAYAYLAEEDVPQASDIIFVFGTHSLHRAEKAIELYKQGLAPVLLGSGRGPFYGSTDNETEAQRYSDAAKAAGVPETAIVMEEQSITLVDNIRRSLNLLNDRNQRFDSLIIVNSPFAQRRGWAMWRKYLDDNIKLYRVNCAPGSNSSAEQWFRNQDGLRIVLGEYVKLRNAVAFDSV